MPDSFLDLFMDIADSIVSQSEELAVEFIKILTLANEAGVESPKDLLEIYNSLEVSDV